MPSQKEHWEKIYGERKPDELSWFQSDPAKSLELIRLSGISKDASLIDVGAGASVLADKLLEQGFSDLTVLDISPAALAYSKERLGGNASKIRWLEADLLQFEPGPQFDLWHDRAVFHFLTDAAQRAKYLSVLKRSLKAKGHLILASFAPDGPEKCSGLPVCRYDAAAMQRELGADFELIREDREDHRTPWDKEQRFRYFLLKRA